MVDADGFPHLLPKPSDPLLNDHSPPQASRHDATPEILPIPATPPLPSFSQRPQSTRSSSDTVVNSVDVARHLPTPSLSPPIQQRQPAIESMQIGTPSPSRAQPLSLFALHKQKHGSSRQHTGSPSHPSSGLDLGPRGPAGTKCRPSSVDHAATGDAQMDSNDELCLSREEHKSVAKNHQHSARQNDVSSPAPADSRAMSIDAVESPVRRESSQLPELSFSVVDSLAVSKCLEEPIWTEAEIERLQIDAIEWLRNYIRVFDTDRSDLASAYSQQALFSLRQFSYLSSPPELPSRPVPVHMGTAGVLTALLDLPDSFAFNVRDAVPQVNYDVVILFDVFVYAQAHVPGVMLTCYVDPARCPSVDEARGWRWVCEMQFVLRPNSWSEEDSSTGGLWRLIAVSHQMTLRKIPLTMDWKWI
ncbi:uncharacterized protein PHACADRAFT_178840 [Phanerochaete carnosa HHB-10118-sp]|uniref:NTF2 domain-containing protein n=1 Tax=Phanerochaete carnosa (strain HHB-10118-sp) TaxID=650164 RepID=K5VTV8_PHACS|nr:uncharacterized protein PHACADRAFT_178840 [Phanerochaete carnosa HHB-10118-sp]EKM50230.1 hypothetical protein PHACADRAFT_178840 [Phanerochaete carnosa HHB-10118-sp]